MNTNYQDIIKKLKKKEIDFSDLSLEVYLFQKESNFLYKRYLQITGRESTVVSKIEDIPFFPIQLFKTNEVKTDSWKEETIFYSSGTGGVRSKHFIRSIEDYWANCLHIFEQYYGSVKNWCIIGLLPDYNTNANSSLINMVNNFMSRSGNPKNAFFSSDLDMLDSRLKWCHRMKVPTLLIGLSFALLDYVSKYQYQNLNWLTVIETGGMKQYNRELTRKELHKKLSVGFGGARIHSEYGMTECMSQMYSLGGLTFQLNDRMHVLISDLTDPFLLVKKGVKGRINIIDLANVHSISFISTQDMGKICVDGTIEILGRINDSDLRGCNYLI